ncbi:MAG: transglutaminase domain-containing protein [Planctomycetota bacterium]|nr:transglutaminase domain-containing protein [Planctomycetota bacterium]
MHRPAALAACVLAALLAAPALARQSQPGRPVKKAPAPPATQPAPAAPEQSPPPPANAAPEKREAPSVGPYIEQSNPRDLALAVHVTINSDSPRDKVQYRDPFSGRVVDFPKITPFEFTTLAIIFPVLPSTSSSDPYTREVMGSLTLNDRLADESIEYMTGYPGGVRFARFDAGSTDRTTTCREVELRMVLPMRCYRTKFDEPNALRVPWPAGPWPQDVASILAPQLYVETGIDAEGNIRPYDAAAVDAALTRWLAEEKISDPKRIAPAALAKILVGKVWTNVQVQGDGLALKRTGELSGVMVQPPAWTLRDQRGSAHDVTVLLAAVLRRAGIPARVLIGWDVSSGDGKFLDKGSKENTLRSWIEFALYDEKANTLNWVPVDIAKLRASTSRPPPLTQPWRYFGTHPDLDSVTPFAFHYHPPTDVVSYGWPGFWGWFITPKPPASAEQSIRLSAAALPVRGGQPPRDPKRPDQPAPSKRGN